MEALITSDVVVSPFDELMAYEMIYTKEGTSRARVSKYIQDNGGLPTHALESLQGLIPDNETYNAISDYISKKLGSFSIVVEGTPQFPRSLKSEKNPLPVFYYRGDISLAESPCISVVGTRKPSQRGIAAAQRIGQALAREKITVVSGLATGIDTAAMTAALKTNGNVIGVIGTPIDKSYPRANASLQEYVATNHLLISQVPIYHYDHQPHEARKYYFTERNVTMATLSKATIIVEAGETSGTRTQAKACLDQNKKLIFLSMAAESISWARHFLDNGALVANNVTEILEMVAS